MSRVVEERGVGCAGGKKRRRRRWKRRFGGIWKRGKESEMFGNV